MKSKFKPGDPITTLDELAKQEFIYCHHKVYHKGWFWSWSLREIQAALQRGARKAVRLTNEEFYADKAHDYLRKRFADDICECCPTRSEGFSSHDDGETSKYCNTGYCDEAFDNWLNRKVN